MSRGCRISIYSKYTAYFDRVLQEDMTIFNTEEMYGRGLGKIDCIGGKTTAIGSLVFFNESFICLSI